MHLSCVFSIGRWGDLFPMMSHFRRSRRYVLSSFECFQPTDDGTLFKWCHEVWHFKAPSSHPHLTSCVSFLGYHLNCFFFSFFYTKKAKTITTIGTATIIITCIITLTCFAKMWWILVPTPCNILLAYCVSLKWFVDSYFMCIHILKNNGMR